MSDNTALILLPDVLHSVNASKFLQDGHGSFLSVFTVMNGYIYEEKCFSPLIGQVSVGYMSESRIAG